MTYYQSVLQPGELVLAVGRLHWAVFLTPLALLVGALGFLLCGAWWADADVRATLDLGAAVCGGLGLMGGVEAAIRRRVTEIVVTDRRVIFKRGLVVRHAMEMNISKIEAVDLDQGLFARLLNYGTLLIRGTGGGFEPLRFIEAPIVIRQAIAAG
jgi:uncharacterized membrane protein YdbT with pleckstrin-like domain